MRLALQNKDAPASLRGRLPLRHSKPKHAEHGRGGEKGKRVAYAATYGNKAQPNPIGKQNQQNPPAAPVLNAHLREREENGVQIQGRLKQQRERRNFGKVPYQALHTLRPYKPLRIIMRLHIALCLPLSRFSGSRIGSVVAHINDARPTFSTARGDQ